MGDGAVQAFNVASPDDAIQAGDLIVKVNSATEVEAMQEGFKTNPVSISISRELSQEEKAKVIEASGIKWIDAVKIHKLNTQFTITDEAKDATPVPTPTLASAEL